MTKNRLALYFDATGKSQNAFGRLVGANSGMVSKWVNGERIPRAFYAMAIQRETADGPGGAIPVEYWAGLESQRMDRQRRRRHTPRVARPVKAPKGPNGLAPKRVGEP